MKIKLPESIKVHTTKSQLLSSALFAIPLSFSLTAGHAVTNQETLQIGAMILPFLLWEIFFTLLLTVVCVFMPQCMDLIANTEEKSKILRWLKYSPKAGLVFWAIKLILLLPAFFNTFPGILAWDFSMQAHTFSEDAYDFYYDAIKAAGLENVYQRGDVIYYNFHPILHNFVIRVCVKIGTIIFASQAAGIAVYTIAQLLLLSFALARLTDTLRRFHVPVIVCLGLSVLAGSWPVNQLLAVSVVKDTPYAAFFILLLCEAAFIISKKEAYLVNRSAYFIFAAIVFFMCAFRKNGIHIYMFSLCVWGIGYCIGIIKNKSLFNYRWLILFITPVILWIIYTGPIFKALRVVEGPPHEALSLPIQQLSRTFFLHEQEMSAEEVTDLERFIPAFRAYVPNVADPPKGVFFDDYYLAHKLAFYSKWVRYGLQYPYEYAYALLALTRNYWYPAALPGDYLLYLDWNVRLTDFHMPIEVERTPLLGFAFLNGYYYRAAYLPESFQNIPVLGFFFNTGFTLLYFLTALRLMLLGKRKYLFLFVPVVGAFGILLLGPLACMRYAWTLWLSLPFSLISICGLYQKSAGTD